MDDIVKPRILAAPKTNVMLVTPELAARWLEGNTHNRPLRQKVVDEYAAEMKAARWVLNGSTIGFDRTGRLLDGQHRLWACVQSETAFTTVVVQDLDEEAFTTIDQGKHRTPGDHMYVAGHDAAGYQTRLAAATGLVWRYRNDRIFGAEKIDSRELIKTVENEPAIKAYLDRMKKAGKGMRGFISPAAACLAIASNKMPSQANLFAESFCSGADLADGSAILVLRNRIINNPPVKNWERFYIVMSCWNAYAKGRSMHKFGHLRSEDFPRIVGA